MTFVAGPNWNTELGFIQCSNATEVAASRVKQKIPRHSAKSLCFNLTVQQRSCTIHLNSSLIPKTRLCISFVPLFARCHSEKWLSAECRGIFCYTLPAAASVALKTLKWIITITDAFQSIIYAATLPGTCTLKLFTDVTYSRVEPLARLHSKSRLPALPSNIQLGWKWLTDKHLRVLRCRISYNRKKFSRANPV